MPGPNRSITPQRRLTAEETKNTQVLTQAMKNEELFKAFRAIAKLKDAYDKGLLDERMRKLYEDAQTEERNLLARSKDYKNISQSFQANSKSGRSEPLADRIVQLAKFNPEALAFMMLIRDVKFLVEVLLVVTGAQMALGTEMAQFEYLKNEDPNRVFDPSDYPYPNGDSAEDALARKMTEDKLAKRKFFHFEFSPDGSKMKLVGTPITNPALITPEICAANSVIPRPTKSLQLRQACIQFCDDLIGVSGDPIALIHKHAQSSDNTPSKSKSQHHDFNDAEAQAILAANRPPAPIRPRG